MQSPIRIEHQPHARIGLDVGGTKTAGGIVLFPEGQVVGRQVIPTRPDRDAQDVLQDTLDLASGLMREAESTGRTVAGIGAGIAELVNGEGEITSAHTIPWRGFPVRQSLSELAPAVVESDVRAAALGEAMYGAGRGYACFVYITVGTGISYSLVLEGQPYAGAHGNALLLASGPMSHTCLHCGERSAMVLEDYASGPAIARRYAATAGRDIVTGEDVIRAANEGDPIAIGVAANAGTELGVAVGFLVNVLDPQEVVVGGGLGSCGGDYWRSLVESTREHIWADASCDIPIVKAALGLDAGIVGAAAACWRHSVQASKEQR